MADPSVMTTAAVVGVAATPPLLLMGAHVDALVLGMMASILVTIWLEQIDSRIKSASAMLMSAILAAYGSPVAAGIVAAQVPSAVIDADALRLLAAACIGAGTPYLVPVIIKRAGRRIEGDK